MIEKNQPIPFIPKDLALNLTVFKSLLYTKIYHKIEYVANTYDYPINVMLGGAGILT